MGMLFLLLLPASLAGKTAADPVPRNRIVTNAELFRLLDVGSPGLEGIDRVLATGDTTGALHVLARVLRERPQPRYFFIPADVRSRVARFREEYPAVAARVIAQADDFIRVYGADVDWRVPGADRLGRPHTPNTVRLLARQWQAENIALAYYLRGDDTAMVTFLRVHVRDFVADYEAGRAETGGNDIFERFYAGHRIRNWMMMHRLLLGTPAWTDDDQILMLKVFLLHAAKLSDVCRKFNWGNHQLVGLTGLFETTLMYPEFAVMRKWNAQSLALIEEHLRREIASDGFQFERASHYFKLDIVNYFRVVRLAGLNGLALPPVFAERFHRMFDAIVALARPDGSLPVLQDAQDTYAGKQEGTSAREGLGEARSANAAELAEPEEDVFMSLGAVLFRDPVYRYFGAREFPAAFFWTMDTSADAIYRSLPETPPTIGSTALRETGYYVMRSGWNRDARYLVIDGGLAHDKPDHTHGGVLGLAAAAYGIDVLPTYRVRYSDPAYRDMKNSLVKNVALADTLLQGRSWKGNAANTGFGIWRILPHPTVNAWLPGRAFVLFSGTHDGFDTIGVVYARSVLFVFGEYWIVTDEFSASSPHLYEQIWQGSFAATDAGRAVSSVSGAALTVAQGERNGLRMSSHQLHGTSSIWFEAGPRAAMSYVTLLSPAATASPVEADIARAPSDGCRRYLIRRGSSTDRLVLGGGGTWKAEDYQSDAAMAVSGTRRDSVAILIVRATRWDGEGLSVRADAPVSLELLHGRDGRWTVAWLDGSTTIVRFADEHGARIVNFEQQHECLLSPDPQ